MKRLITCTIFVTAFLLLIPQAFSAAELRGGAQDLREFLGTSNNVVTIKGEAEEITYTNKAVVSLIVTTTNKQLAKAVEANRKLRSAIKTTLTSNGLRAKHIHNSNFSTSPQYGLLGSSPNSYKVVNRMAIGIQDEVHLQQIAAIADQHAEIEVSGTEFQHSDADLFKNRVKEEALFQVLAKQKFYEKNLGINLTPVNFKDAEVTVTATAGANILKGAVMAGISKHREDDKLKRIAPPLEQAFDEIRYRATITVDFLIE